MKKKMVIAVVGIAVLAAAAFIMHVNNSRAELPDKELVYLQLDTKGEDFVLSQMGGVAREELIEKWGNPDGMLSGFYGEIWAITESESILVYYSDESTIAHIKLLQKDENNN